MQYKRKRAGLLKSALLGAATLGVVSLAGIGVAQAGTINVQTANIQWKQTVSLSGTVDGTNFTGKYPHGVYAGQFSLGLSDGTNLAGWCVDLFNDILPPYPPFTMSEGNFTMDGGGTSLTSTQIADIGLLAAYGNQLIAGDTTSGTKKADAANIQSAIWLEEYNSNGSSSGLSIFNKTTKTAFQQSDLTALLTNATSAVDTNHLQYVELSGTSRSKTLQHLLVVNTPEPGSLALLGTGLLGLGLVARRRRRKAA